MAYPIRITTFCQCGRLIVTIATEYKTYNQDNTPHTCGGTMADSEHLTYRDCPYYTRVSFGDESQSLCNLTGKLCHADEVGLSCSMWEEEKAEMLKEENEMLKKHCSHLVSDCFDFLKEEEHLHDKIAKQFSEESEQLKDLPFNRECYDPCCMCHVKEEEITDKCPECGTILKVHAVHGIMVCSNCKWTLPPFSDTIEAINLLKQQDALPDISSESS